MRKLLLFLFFVFVLAIIPCSSVTATGFDFDYADFATVTGLNFVGNAAQSGSVARLTPDLGGQVGAMWYNTKVPVDQPFTSTFKFTISDSVDPAADGFAFVIQNSSGTAIGTGGSELGYGGISNSVAVEFDTFISDSYNDPPSNHIAVMSHGTSPNSADHASSLGSVNIIPYIPGVEHTVVIQYIPGSLAIFYDDPDLDFPILEVPMNLRTLLNLETGQFAYIGFTAATGGESEVHDILSWSYDPLNMGCSMQDFFDDDVLSTEWTYVKPFWSEANGVLNGTPTGRKAVAVTNSILGNCQDCSRHAEITISPGVFSKAWMLAWYVDKKNTIEILAAPNNDKWIVKKRSNGVVVAKAKGLKTIDTDVPYNVRVLYDGTNVYLFVDNPYVPLVVLNVGTLPSGSTGFQVKNAAMTVDNFCAAPTD